MPEFTKDPNERGVLWTRTGQRGTYFTGQIDGQPCVVFRNQKKAEGSKAPDWIVLKPKPKDPPPPGTHIRDEAVGTNEPIWGDEHRAMLPDEEPPF